MKNIFSVFIILSFFFLFNTDVSAQKEGKLNISITNLDYFKKDTLRNRVGGDFLFKVTKSIEALGVSNQGKTGTCWSFSTLSFFESEIIKNKKLTVKLSEMFIVRNAYIEKAIKYVRMHGKNNFAQGGAFHDIPYIIKKYGIVPEEAYKGKTYKGKKHNHEELEKVLKNSLDAIISSKKISNVWLQAITAIIDSYLGTPPKEFKYRGKTYTPTDFRAYLGIKTDDYVELSSFTHHPFYEKFTLEVPDNWTMGQVYNLPLNEFMETINYAIDKGHSVAWGSDVSEKGFSFKNGMAIILTDELHKERTKKKKKKKDKKINYFKYPIKEKEITQKLRQEGFDNYSTTDDHGMHIIGRSNDQDGRKYYIVKNSWGEEKNDTKGYFFASETFVKAKTIDILVKKDAIPQSIKNKLGIK